MRILQVNPEKTWRGGERQTLFTATALAERGIECGVLCRKGSPLAERLRACSQQTGISIHEAGSAREFLTILAGIGRKYDIVHAQSARAQSLAVLARPLHRTPVVYTRRVVFRPSGPLTRLKYRACHTTVAISEAIRDILGEFGVRDTPVIPSAIPDPESFPEQTDQFTTAFCQPGRFIVGAVSALSPEKDPLTLVRAAAFLREKRGPDFLLLHFGEGPLQADAERLARDLGAADCVRFCGFQPDVEAAYPLFDVFVMSSVEEGLGSSVLDAFVRGVPVVCTTAGGLRELAGPQPSGKERIADCTASGCRALAVSPADPLALSRSIDAILSDPALAAVVTANAAGYVREKHTVDAMAKSYIDLYSRIIS